MPDIDYRELTDDSFEARTDDGFVIVISREFLDGYRYIEVWPLGFTGAGIKDKRHSLTSCKKSAETFLESLRALSAHWHEQGRAEVRAAQGEMAKELHDFKLTEAVSRMDKERY